ncbi:MAG TPA: helicase-related protein [Labilithrix sp.]
MSSRPPFGLSAAAAPRTSGAEVVAPKARKRREAVVEALAPVDVLPGLGPTARVALEENGIKTVADLVWLPPATYDDLRAPKSLAEAIAQAKAARQVGMLRGPRVVAAAIVRSGGVVPIRGRRCVRLVLRDEHDDKCTLHVFWFFLAHGILAAAKPGTRMLFVGRIAIEDGKPARAAHPDLVVDAPETRIVRARYPRLAASEKKRATPEGALRRAIRHAIAAGVTPDPVPAAIALREAMTDVAQVLREVHAVPRMIAEETAEPVVEGAAEPPSDGSRRAFVERLAWAEAFTRVWERITRDAETSLDPAPAIPPDPALVDTLERELGFSLTGDQRAAIDAIAADMDQWRPMRRLLLGDVGTGKTAVALAAAAQAVAAGRQVAILAPTSVLAEQDLDALRPLERAANATIAFVAGGGPASARRAAERALEAGKADIAIGTHALLGEGIAIPRLGLVIVDEQQRLGVGQRLALVKKGARPHLLTLSATPIPRTLALALRGELATSTLRERPANRGAVATELAPKSELDRVVARVAETCARGERVFWVVPRIDNLDDDDDDPLASVAFRADALEKALAPRKVVLLHGGLKATEKSNAMRAFRRGAADVLVGTTVIEVGVDVPEATLMVVENAEQFGLAQLHQLRGRVGRGAKPGGCVLVHDEPLEGLARARLDAMTKLSEGEAVARADLELRGSGDLGGTRQHGEEEELVWLEPNATYAWLDRIEEDARAARETDPELAAPEHRVLASLVARMRRIFSVREEAG